MTGEATPTRVKIERQPVLPKHVMIATCSGHDNLHFATVDSLVAICSELQQRDTKTFNVRIKDTSLDAARMRAAHEFLSIPECEKLLLLDPEVLTTPQQLLQLLSLDRDVVALAVPKPLIVWDQVALVASQAPQAIPYAGSTYTLTGDPQPLAEDGTVQIVNTLPLGCVAIKRDVFFKLADENPDLACQVPDSIFATMYALWLPMIENGMYLRPDLAFAYRLAKAGIELRMLVSEAPSRIGTHVYPGNINPTMFEMPAAEEEKS